MVKGFKFAHGKALGIIPPSDFTPGGEHTLNHVYSWKNIRISVSDVIEEAAILGVSTTKTRLNELAEKIFEKDNAAVVNFDYFTHSKVFMKHIDYLKSGITGFQNLQDLNDFMLSQAKQHIKNLDFSKSTATILSSNKAKIIELLRILNSAPANLRYGHLNTNSSIQEFLDLMGDSTGEPTAKEMEIALFLNTKYKCVNSIINVEKCSGVYCIKSSTGKQKMDNGYYYMKFPSDLIF